MNGIKCWWATVSLVLMAGFSGCGKSSTGESDQSETRDGETARQVWDSTVARYQAAVSYRDGARLNLQYRLSGRWIEEYHPHSICFDRRVGLKASVFHARIQADRERFTCFVFDSATGNLDNQVWVQQSFGKLNQASDPAPGTFWADTWQALLDDPIAYHFVSGKSEIPLAENSAEAVAPVFPPLLSLLLGNDCSGNWRNPERCSWAPRDDDSNEEADYRIQIENAGLIHHVWVSRQTGLMTRLRFDPAVLNEKLSNTREVTDIQLELEFENAELDSKIDGSEFATDLAKRARPVKKFVQIPQPFPSDFVGREIPDFQLRVDDRVQVAARRLRGQVNCMLFLQADFVHQDVLKEYLELAKIIQGPTVRAGLVLVGPREASRAIENEWQRKLTAVNVYNDPEQATVRAMRIQQLPCLVVMDRATRVQFFRVVDPSESVIRSTNRSGQTSWSGELISAVQRIEKGEDLASEMRRDYSRFLDQYAKNLAEANPLRPVQAANNIQSASAQNRRVVLPDPKWKVSLEHPGWIASGQGTRRYIELLSGFRKVVRLNELGKKTNEWTLELPAGIPVTRLTSTQSAEGKSWKIAYQPGASQLFIFDEDWNLLLQYPKKSDSGRQLVGIVAADLDQNLVPELYVGWAGADEIHRVDLESGNRHSLVSMPGLTFLGVTSSAKGKPLLLTETKQGVVGLLDKDLARLDQPVRFSGSLLTTAWGSVGAACGVIAVQDGEKLILKNNPWEKMIPIQLRKAIPPDSRIHVACWPAKSGKLMAVALPGGEIALVRDSMEISRWEVGEPVNGFEICMLNKELCLVFSTNESVYAIPVANSK